MRFFCKFEINISRKQSWFSMLRTLTRKGFGLKVKHDDNWLMMLKNELSMKMNRLKANKFIKLKNGRCESFGMKFSIFRKYTKKQLPLIDNIGKTLKNKIESLSLKNYASYRKYRRHEAKK